MRIQTLAALAALTLASPAVAAPDLVSAHKPQGLVDALVAKGYVAALSRDDTGDPLINLELSGWKGALLFYDCDAASHDGCRSVQFRAKFDADAPGMSAADALRFVATRRYGALTLDAKGDPVVTWDVWMGAGVPRAVFQEAAGQFAATLAALGGQLYPAAR